MPRPTVAPVAALVAALACACAESPPAAGGVADERLASFLASNCADCHGEWVQEGGLDLESLSDDLTDPEVRRVWVQAHDRLEAGEMPPPEDAALTDGERAAALAALAAAVRAAEAADEPPAMRRLNRTEYEYALRDLLGTPHLDVADRLPADAEAYGFDHVGSALRSSPVQLARLLEAADAALRGAAALGPEPRHFVDRRRFPDIQRFRSTQDRVIVGGREEGVAVILRQPNTAQTPWRISDFIVPYAAEYRIRLRTRTATFSTPGRTRHPAFGTDKSGRGKEAYEIEPAGETLSAPGEPAEPQALAVFADTRRLGVFDLSADWSEPELTAFVAPGEELRLHIPTMTDRSGSWKGGDYTGPGVVLDWIEIEGPLGPDGSPAAWPTPGYRTLFGDLPVRRWSERDGAIPPPVVEWFGHPKKHPELKTPPKDLRLTVVPEDPAADARRLLARFLPIAFRRPVADAEVERYLALAVARLDEGAPFAEAMFTGYTAALCSPDFLLVGRRPGEAADFALAERLALFLWRSLPDEELRSLAAAGVLDDPAELDRQADRMLADPRSDRLIEDLAGQWLGLRAIADTLPDGRLYPEYDELLGASMGLETLAFLRAMLDRDLPARTLIDSDFAVLNGPLAELYGVGGVEGVEMRKVPLPTAGPGAVRGGVLTQAAVLKVTANGTTTSPVVRGAWVLDRLLGVPAPPPPPNVPAIEPDTRGAVTVRQLLEQHRADPACAGCHAKIDPPGFALEQFDAIGTLRDRYRVYDGAGDRGGFEDGPPVDAAGATADGRAFDGVDQFRALLLEDERQIARNLARRLLIFALAEDPTFTDRETVEAILDETADKEWGFRSLIRAVVLSDAFRP